MKLTKKHLWGLYDVRGSDGSWAYQLIGVKKGKLLFYVFGSYPPRYEIDQQTYTDWRPFEPQIRDSRWDKTAWDTARETK